MMLLPPVWFRVMNPRLLAAVDNDPARINFRDPAQAETVSAPATGTA